MSINIGAIFSELAQVYSEFLLDEGELAAGVAVTLPIEPQIGTINGSAVYLNAVLTTSKNVAAPSVATASASKELVVPVTAENVKPSSVVTVAPGESVLVASTHPAPVAVSESAETPVAVAPENSEVEANAEAAVNPEQKALDEQFPPAEHVG